MKKLLLIVLPLVALFSSCNQLSNNYGEKIAFDKNEVYYKGKGVTKADAQKLGDYLEEQKYFDDERAKSAQITYGEDTYIVHLVMDEKKLDDAARLNLWKLQYDLSEKVFDGKATRIAIADDALKDLEVLNPIARYGVGKKSSVYYDNSEIKRSEAKKLAEFFTEQKLLSKDKEVDVFYKKESGRPEVRIVVDEKAVKKNKDIIKAFSYWQELMREQLFDDSKAKLILTATNYNDIQAVPKLKAEDRALFEKTEDNTLTTDTETSVDSLTMQTSSGVIRLN